MAKNMNLTHVLSLFLLFVGHALPAENKCKWPRNSDAEISAIAKAELSRELKACTQLNDQQISVLSSLATNGGHKDIVLLKIFFLENLNKNPRLLDDYLLILRSGHMFLRLGVIYSIEHSTEIFRPRASKLFEIALAFKGQSQAVLMEQIAWLDPNFSPQVIAIFNKQIESQKNNDWLWYLTALIRLYGDHFSVYLAAQLKSNLPVDQKIWIIQAISEKRYGGDASFILSRTLSNLLVAPEKKYYQPLCNFLISLKPDHPENLVAQYLSQTNYDFSIHCMDLLTENGMGPFERFDANSQLYLNSGNKLLRKFAEDYKKRKGK
jgi:hypothetical protein